MALLNLYIKVGTLRKNTLFLLVLLLPFPSIAVNTEIPPDSEQNNSQYLDFIEPLLDKLLVQCVVKASSFELMQTKGAIVLSNERYDQYTAFIKATSRGSEVLNICSWKKSQDRVFSDKIFRGPKFKCRVMGLSMEGAEMCSEPNNKYTFPEIMWHWEMESGTRSVYKNSSPSSLYYVIDQLINSRISLEDVHNNIEKDVSWGTYYFSDYVNSVKVYESINESMFNEWCEYIKEMDINLFPSSPEAELCME